MINHLSGKIIDKSAGSITLDVQGVGYKVFVPKTSLELPKIGTQLSLYIYMAVREDDISLYGFQSKEALEFFELLISVNRVGPKLGLGIMEVPLAKVKQAVAKKDIAFLSHIPGIGKKTAERIIIELQDKIELEILEGEFGAEEDAFGFSQDIIDALMKLGYQRQHIQNVLRRLPKDIKKEEAVIKFFLQNA